VAKTYHTRLDRVFAALSDRTRRSMLEKLQRKEYSVLELAEDYEITFQAVSKHLKYLDKAELIHRKKVGRNYYCSYNSEPLTDAVAWISQNYELWQTSLDSMEALLDKLNPNRKTQ